MHGSHLTPNNNIIHFFLVNLYTMTGLPEPQINHFVIMARFAWECRNAMHQMMIELEKRLGPDCSDLVLRLGM